MWSSSTSCYSSFFFFNDTATTEIYTLSLHDALPILRRDHLHRSARNLGRLCLLRRTPDRKSTRLNSSHPSTSYAVFCLKKKNNTSLSHVLTKNNKYAPSSPTARYKN